MSKEATTLQHDHETNWVSFVKREASNSNSIYENKKVPSKEIVKGQSAILVVRNVL